MQEDEKIVAIGFFTAPEFRRWGSRLNHVYPIEENDQFKDLLKAINEADKKSRTKQ